MLSHFENYRWLRRWHVEQLFRSSISGGFDQLESSLLLGPILGFALLGQIQECVHEFVWVYFGNGTRTPLVKLLVLFVASLFALHNVEFLLEEVKVLLEIIVVQVEALDHLFYLFLRRGFVRRSKNLH